MPTSLEDLRSLSLYVACLAEFLSAVFLLVLGAGACTAPEANVLTTALGFGLAVTYLVWATSRVSGGHINTAVTLGFLVTRKISVVRALFYMVCQILGAIVGAAIISAVQPGNGDICTPSLHKDMSAVQGMGIELLLVFVFVFVILASCDEHRTDLGGSIPLTIGLTLAGGHLWALKLTGAGMNPARVLGSAVVSNKWDNHWVYWVGPIIGSIAAALLYDFVFAVNATRQKPRRFLRRNYIESQDYDDVKGIDNGAVTQSHESTQ